MAYRYWSPDGIRSREMDGHFFSSAIHRYFAYFPIFGQSFEVKQKFRAPTLRGKRLPWARMTWTRKLFWKRYFVAVFRRFMPFCQFSAIWRAVGTRRWHPHVVVDVTREFWRGNDRGQCWGDFCGFEANFLALKWSLVSFWEKFWLFLEILKIICLKV